jgi:hypothetical protein|tara:strand:+ start:211 stop:483 length:273 start_codon:yes stop_codon:yes gene_type:complete
MKIKTRSILQELNAIADRKDSEAIIESRAANILNSAINLMELIHKTYDEQTALDLERRFINSIKGSDVSKFNRGIRKITESKRQKDNNVG